jgi:hypothetical protein
MFIPSISLLAIRATSITPENKSTAITIATWLLMMIFIIMFFMREAIKFAVLRKFAMDDLFILLAVVCSSDAEQLTLLTSTDICYWIFSSVTHTCIGRTGCTWKTYDSTRKCNHERTLRVRLSLHTFDRICEALPGHVLSQYCCPTNATPCSSRSWYLHRRLDLSITTRSSLSMWTSTSMGNADTALLQ